jgi:hypothetical protein
VNLTALQTAFTDRGWARLSTTQQTQHINDGLHELDAQEPRWPYLLTTTTGTAPLTTADLLEVSLVLNTSTNTPVSYIDYEDLAERYGDLTLTATDPGYWYFTPGSTTSISTYPVTTRTLKLVYWKVSSDLSAGSDTPLSPARWHSVIVDLADRNACRVKKDFASAAGLQATIDGKLAAMRVDLLYRQTAGASQVMPFWQDTF